MHLPSFIWLWRLAAWSMGITVFLFFALAIMGYILRQQRLRTGPPPWLWLRRLHRAAGLLMVLLVLNLLAIGVIGTLGHFGSLGHSSHLPAGLVVVALTLGSAWAAVQIHPRRPWARVVHLGCNGALLGALVWVSLTGWAVVQKYMP